MTDRASSDLVDVRLVRAVTLFAVSVAVVLALAIPAIYWVASWQREFAKAQAEATILAAAVSEYATRNPDLWEFEGHRISGILGVGAEGGLRRVFGDHGPVAESGRTPDAAPVLRVRAPIFDGSSKTAGEVEVTRPISGVYVETAIAGAIASLLAIAAFIALRLVPLRVLKRALKSSTLARDRAERAEATARRSLASAEASDRGKARFLGAMNHEFRTPIGQVVGFSEIILSEALSGRAGSVQVGWLQDINAAARHLLELLEDATRYARLDDTGNSLNLRALALDELAKGGIDLAQPALRKAGATAQLERGGQSPEALVDASQIIEGVACLLREFARRAPPNAVIRVMCQSNADEAEIRLDCSEVDIKGGTLLDGLRAPLDAPGVLTRGLEGSGLGIAVAERIVRLHGGRLWIGMAQTGGLSMAYFLPLREGARAGAGQQLMFDVRTPH